MAFISTPVSITRWSVLCIEARPVPSIRCAAALRRVSPICMAQTSSTSPSVKTTTRKKAAASSTKELAPKTIKDKTPKDKTPKDKTPKDKTGEKVSKSSRAKASSALSKSSEGAESAASSKQPNKRRGRPPASEVLAAKALEAAKPKRLSGMNKVYLIENSVLASKFQDGIATRSEICSYVSQYAREKKLMMENKALGFQLDAYLQDIFKNSMWRSKEVAMRQKPGAKGPWTMNFLEINSALNAVIKGPNNLTEAQRAKDKRVALAAKKQAAILAQPRKIRGPRDNSALRARQVGLFKVIQYSPGLAKIIQMTTGSRTDGLREVWAYIKKNNLQDPNSKRTIVCDAKMKAAFKVDQIDQFQLLKYLEANYIDPK